MKKSFLESTPIHDLSSILKIMNFSWQPNSSCFRLHWHERMELLHVKRGRLYVENGNESISAVTGELIIIPPKSLHMGYTLDEEAEYDVLMFDVRSFYNETEMCKTLLSAIFDGSAVFKKLHQT